jgi:translation initiation factor IF-2
VLEDRHDDTEDLLSRSPVVTIMGHVDHGKTSLLDFIRRTNVVAGESGGITQHIGAYKVRLPNGRQVTFLDTPGHEAFTAMRARGAQVTDIVVLVVAADDAVMPQTIEAINHAQAANVPIIVAINKIDRPEANSQRIKQQLADRNILVEEWGGKYQCIELSAKTGFNVEVLLEKILLETDMMELRANPDRVARGVVIESELDKGRGITATVLVQKGTLSVGDPFIAGVYFGKVRAMFDERNNRVDTAPPSTPVSVLGFEGAPQAGDVFIVMDSERDARDIALKRQQLKREQDNRQVKHLTLDEISRQISIGGVKELPIIVKGDVDGSVEALADSFMKLSNEEVVVRVIHRGVGAISESDVLLADASNAIIIGFHVRPHLNARKLAEANKVDIRIYNIIYNAIAEVKAALEGLLSPIISEEVTATVSVREIFKVPKVGTVAGCYVQEGKLVRNNKVRLIREGIVVFEGELDSLKRFKDDVREVDAGYECGLSVHNFNDIKPGDTLEAYRIIETKKKLD